MNSATAERALVARCLVSPDQIPGTLSLDAEDFSLPDLGRVFAVIRKRFENGEAVDVVLVQEECGVEIDILELTPASFAPIETYVGSIKEAALRRRLVAHLDKARAEVAAGTGDPLGTITAAIDRIASTKGVAGLRRASEVVRAYRDEFPRRATGGAGIPYGIDALDSALLPMRGGRFVVFASRPGIGKTALMESVADQAARRGPVLFVSLEMTAEELLDRGMARESGIKAKEIITGRTDITMLDEHLKVRSDLPIIYVDEGGTTSADILAKAQQVKIREGALGLVVVDYLQLVADRGDNEVYRVGAISHALKRMALTLKVPVLAAAQLNRNIESEGRKPRLSDLRDSGAIEQDADVVMIMTGTPYEPERKLHILKQRQGSTGQVELNFDGDTQRWSGPPVPATQW